MSLENRVGSESQILHKDAYQLITDRILEKLERGVVPWKRPWTYEVPKNLVSLKPYRGINLLILHTSGYEQPYWLTYKQSKDLGGYVKKGEKATPVVYWNYYDQEERDPVTGEIQSTQKRAFLKYYSVFNVEQTEGLENKIPRNKLHDETPIFTAEDVIRNMPNLPKIVEWNEPAACYFPASDTIKTPRYRRFIQQEHYYSTLFHELTHSTGHEKRLGRFDSQQRVAPFGSEVYSKEELIAEMGSAFLAWHTRIDNVTEEASASYINGWLASLKSDKRLLITAAGQAQKSTDYILGQYPYGEQSGPSISGINLSEDYTP